MNNLGDTAQNAFIVICAIIIFIIVRKILTITYSGRAGKIYKSAIASGSIVTARKISSNVVRTYEGDRTNSNRQDAVYEYFVDGKSYKKVIVYDSIEPLSPAKLSITLYYDKKCPKRAVTKNESIGTDRTVKIIFITLMITIALINIIVRIFGIK
ncbi:MAG: hypothetical protein HFH65_11315 [Lachnospiraceae bacterium]|nr:hypothetical protein [Lachnospiraceae bacterium]